MPKQFFNLPRTDTPQYIAPIPESTAQQILNNLNNFFGSNVLDHVHANPKKLAWPMLRLIERFLNIPRYKILDFLRPYEYTLPKHYVIKISNFTVLPTSHPTYAEAYWELLLHCIEVAVFLKIRSCSTAYASYAGQQIFAFHGEDFLFQLNTLFVEIQYHQAYCTMQHAFLYCTKVLDATTDPVLHAGIGLEDLNTRKDIQVFLEPFDSNQFNKALLVDLKNRQSRLFDAYRTLCECESETSKIIVSKIETTLSTHTASQVDLHKKLTVHFIEFACSKQSIETFLANLDAALSPLTFQSVCRLM